VHYHNYQIPFWAGVTIAFIALIANHWLPRGAHGEHCPPVTPMQEQAERIVVP
jgi:hypothetical protein